MYNRRLFLIRGLAGSGKSTLANMIRSAFAGQHGDCEMFSADDYFYDIRGYVFDKDYLPQAHAWCQKKANTWMTHGNRKNCVVIIHNTFSTNWEMEKYKKMAAECGFEVFIVECQNDFGSVHDVPPAVIEKMKERWETVNE